MVEIPKSLQYISRIMVEIPKSLQQLNIGLRQGESLSPVQFSMFPCMISIVTFL